MVNITGKLGNSERNGSFQYRLQFKDRKAKQTLSHLYTSYSKARKLFRKSNVYQLSNSEAYLEPNRRSTMELYCQNS